MLLVVVSSQDQERRSGLLGPRCEQGVREAVLVDENRVRLVFETVEPGDERRGRPAERLVRELERVR